MMGTAGVSSGKGSEWQGENQEGESPPEGLVYICPYHVALLLPP